MHWGVGGGYMYTGCGAPLYTQLIRASLISNGDIIEKWLDFIPLTGVITVT